MAKEIILNAREHGKTPSTIIALFNSGFVSLTPKDLSILRAAAYRPHSPNLDAVRLERLQELINIYCAVTKEVRGIYQTAQEQIKQVFKEAFDE